MASTLQRSRDKNARGALALWLFALYSGDALRVELARAILAECGYPGGEGARPINEVMEAIRERDGD